MSLSLSSNGLAGQKSHPVGTHRRPCLECKRRRVKCDEELPTCVRCSRDGITCPGYIRVRQWDCSRQHWQHRPRKRDTASASHVEDVVSNNQRAMQVSASLSPTDDKDYRLLFESIVFCNSHILRLNSPAKLPFQRQQIDIDIVPTLPEVLQTFVVFMARTFQIAMNTTTDPLAIPDICYYRGKCLKGLNTMLPDVMKNSQRSMATHVLGILPALVQAELCAGLESWWLHLSAARQIISLLGGLRQCIRGHPYTQGPLVNIMMIDILAATTTRVDLLDLRCMEAQRDYLRLDSDWEEMIVSNSYAMPLAIAQAIVETNILRSRVHWEKALSSKDKSLRDSILFSLSTFDPEAWSANILSIGRTPPLDVIEWLLVSAQASAWISLGQAYKLAAMLYILLSCPYSSKPCPVDYQRILGLKRTLTAQLEALVSKAKFNDPDGNVETQLWKFASWPFMVSAYVRIGWGIGDENVEMEMERLRVIGAAMQYRPLRVDAVRLMKMVADRQQDDGKRREWNWDDAFCSGNGRWAFVV